MDITRRNVLLSTAAVALANVPGMTAAAATQPIDPSRLSPSRYKAASRKLMIPMRDGVKLMAKVIYPEDAEPGARFPVIIDYTPYRTTERDGLGGGFGFFAERGYHAIFLDIRGTGGSEGVPTPNQYSEQEQEDALDAIAWLAKQPWCNGNIGVQGTSYSGFNAIQIAALGPPALKAIIPAFFTDDVYADDIMYYGGALEGESLGRWPFGMIANMGLPASPALDVDSMEARQRFDQEPWLFDMLRHQTNDAFWQRQSVRPHYDRIKVPTLMFAGWLDAYTDSVPRMIENLKVPCRGIIGPWTHGMGLPGPAIDSDLERLRWWDQWLKGMDTGVLSEPKLAIYMNESYKPDLEMVNVPGYWRSERAWPKGQELKFYPQPDDKLLHNRSAPLRRDLSYKPSVGITNRYRCPHDSDELPVDQRPDDDFSLCFDTPPLEQEITILGFPKASLHVSATAPVATWIVRLCDVAPDGTSTLVSKGILNGCQRQSRSEPQELVPEQIYRLNIDLKAISWAFPKGHKVRIAICNADFPNLWPSPYAMTTSLYAGSDHDSYFTLPLCPPATLPAPVFARPPATGIPDQPPVNQWTVTRDEMAHSMTVFRETAQPASKRGPAVGSFGAFQRRWITVFDKDPAKVVLRAEGRAQSTRGSDLIRVDTAMLIESDVKSFLIKASRVLSVNGTTTRTKSWEDRIPRRFT